MKKLSIQFLTIIALVFTFTFAANAQRGGEKTFNPEKMAEKETAQMVEKLALDDAQTEKISTINLDFAKKMQEAKEANKDNRDALKQIKTINQKEKDAKVKQVLTATQLKTYEEMQLNKEKDKADEGRNRGEGRSRGGGRNGGGGRSGGRR